MRWRTLRAQVRLAMLLLALVPAALLGVVTYRTAAAGIERGANAALVASAARAAASLDGWVDATLDAVRTPAALPDLRHFVRQPADPAARAEALEVLTLLLRSDPVSLLSVSVLDPTGRMLLAPDDALEGTRRPLDPALQRAIATRTPQMDDVRALAGDSLGASLVVGMPILLDGQPRAVLRAEYHAAVLSRVLHEAMQPVGSGASAILYDRFNIRLAGELPAAQLLRTQNRLADSIAGRLAAEGRLRPDPTGPDAVERRIRALTPWRDSTGLDSTYIYRLQQRTGAAAPVERLGASVPLRTREWRVSVEQPRDVALGDTLRTLLVRSVAIGALVLTLLWWVSGAVARRLTEPLAELTQGAERFAAGDLAARVDLPRGDELGTLGRAFNDLAGRVGSLLQRLAQRTRELEADIAMRQRLEEELVQTRKLEAVGKLAGGVAHDFNNLLMVIQQNAELAREATALPPTVREGLADIEDAAARGAQLTRQLLAFAKRGATAPRALDLGLQVREAERLLRQLVGSSVVLDLVLPDEALPVFMDPSQVEQVLINLVANARDAMPRGGTLTIGAAREVGEIGAAGAAAQPVVVLTVQDTGVGMAPDVLARAFEPFFSTKTAGGRSGTGLGLATVYGIVRQAGGDVAVRSAPGEGTAVRVVLPWHEGAVAPDGGEAVVSWSPSGGERVLLVEDEPAVRVAMARALRRAGYRVLEAADGVEGLAMGRTEGAALDLLICDVVMPGADGFLVAGSLRRAFPGLAVLLVSGYSDDVRQSHGGDAASFPMLEKPFAVETLLTTVREVLDARR
jgi:signal transduction histidine kinase